MDEIGIQQSLNDIVEYLRACEDIETMSSIQTERETGNETRHDSTQQNRDQRVQPSSIKGVRQEAVSTAMTQGIN